jgi:hypothetical protein
MDGFVDRLHALRFLRACDPSYRALTFALMGLPPTEDISLSLTYHAIAITPAPPMKLVRSSLFIDCGLPCVTVRPAPAIAFSSLLSVHSRYGLHARGVAKRPFTSKAPTAPLPRLPLRLLPGGANQFSGGSCTR